METNGDFISIPGLIMFLVDASHKMMDAVEQTDDPLTARELTAMARAYTELGYALANLLD